MPRGARHKISRRFGMDIYGSGGDSLQRRIGTPPGGHAQGRRRRRSLYGEQLNEKQKVKAVYGVQERQLRRYFSDAERRDGEPGANLLATLERRLDNVVYRLGLARTRPMARQLVSHGHVDVDGRRVDIPSFLVDPEGVVSLRESATEIPAVVEAAASGRPVPGWLERRPDGIGGRVVRLPERDDIDYPVDERLIVGFYSR